MSLKSVLLVILVWMLFASIAQAESLSSAIQAQDVVKLGSLEIGLMSGYLQGNELSTSTSSNRSALYILPRAAMVMTPELGSRFYAGNLAVGLEPLYAHYFKPFGATAAGGSLLFKYNFLSFGRWMPFWDVRPKPLAIGHADRRECAGIQDGILGDDAISEQNPGHHGVYFVGRQGPRCRQRHRLLCPT